MAGHIAVLRDDKGKTIGYRARWRDPAGRHREKRFATRRQATDHLALVAADIRRGDYLDPDRGTMLLREVAAEWQSVQVTQRPSTLDGYDAALRVHVLPFLGDRQVCSISPHDVRRFIAHLAQQGKSAGTIRNSYRVLKPVLDTAVDLGCIRRNPCGPLKRGSLPPASRQEMLFLSGPQVAQLADALPVPYGTLVYLAAYTGMRAGEIAALRMPNLDLLRGRLRVVESLSEIGAKQFIVPPKTGEQRDILLPAFLVRMLERHIAEHPPVHGYLFTGRPPRGRELSTNHADHRLRHSSWFYPHVYKPAVRRSGLDPALRFHDLRHTCASLLIERNVQMKAISRQLGHSTIQITMDRYGHLLPSVEEKMAGALDEAFHEALQTRPHAPRRLA